MRVVLVSDTHLPATGTTVPEPVAGYLREADHVIHAGDFITPRAEFEIRVLAGGELTAVRGNRDPQLSLPAVATVDVDGVRFVVTHGDDIGRGEAYERGLTELAKDHDADVAVGGHTHHTLVSSRDGIRLLNPGSATGAPPAHGPTCIAVECDGGLVDVTLHD